MKPAARTTLQLPPAAIRGTGTALLGRIRHALPAWRSTLAGAAIWAATMGASAAFNLLRDHWETPAKIRLVILLFALGGLLAFPTAIFLARILSLGRRPEAAFAAAFTCLLAATIGFTSGLYGLEYRAYYSEWHAPFPTRLWANEFVFTVAAGVYQFAVLGIRMFFPIGFAALFLAGIWFARTQRRRALPPALLRGGPLPLPRTER